jgi:hypothetical protein
MRLQVYGVGSNQPTSSLFEAWYESRLPMEPELAPCGWRCPHRRPTAVMGSIDNFVMWYQIYRQLLTGPA